VIISARERLSKDGVVHLELFLTFLCLPPTFVAGAEKVGKRKGPIPIAIGTAQGEVGVEFVRFSVQGDF
jgi:hypothetical protein